MSIEFVCDKDPLVAEYHRTVLGPLFEADWERYAPLGEGDLKALQTKWKTQMLAEAQFQEHYDFTVDEQDHRQVRRYSSGIPMLLIPEVVVS